MATGLEAAHRRLKRAQIAVASFDDRTKGRGLTELTDEEVAEKLKLRQEEVDAEGNLYRAEHGGS